MRNSLALLAVSGTIALSACAPMSNDEIIGGMIGATAGAITAKALNADDDWLIIGTLAGATAGTVIARNQANRQCAYARGDGTYYTAPCR